MIPCLFGQKWAGASRTVTGEWRGQLTSCTRALSCFSLTPYLNLYRASRNTDISSQYLQSRPPRTSLFMLNCITSWPELDFPSAAVAVTAIHSKLLQLTGGQCIENARYPILNVFYHPCIAYALRKISGDLRCYRPPQRRRTQV